jgi:Protein of unknown function (DUF2975)
MNTSSKSELTEPLQSVIAFFGMLTLIGLMAGTVLVLIGSGPVGFSDGVCVTQPGTTYGSSAWHPVFASARPGGSISVVGTLQACANHPGIVQRVLYSLTVLPSVVFWCGVLLLLWRIIVVARRTGPFTPRIAAAMSRLGWFVMIGSAAAAIVQRLAIAQLLMSMARVPNPYADLLTVPVHLVIPVLVGAALLTFTRIIGAGSAMDEEIRATI